MARTSPEYEAAVEAGICRECEACTGTGKCTQCDWTGECANCAGTGQDVSPHNENPDEDCPDCQGSGVCVECGGDIECQQCDGTGYQCTDEGTWHGHELRG